MNASTVCKTNATPFLFRIWWLAHMTTASLYSFSPASLLHAIKRLSLRMVGLSSPWFQSIMQRPPLSLRPLRRHIGRASLDRVDCGPVLQVGGHRSRTKVWNCWSLNKLTRRRTDELARMEVLGPGGEMASDHRQQRSNMKSRPRPRSKNIQRNPIFRLDIV